MQIKKKIEFLDMNTVWEMKYLLDEINSRLDIAEEMISELGIKTEIIKHEIQWEFLNIRDRERETKVSQIGKK